MIKLNSLTSLRFFAAIWVVFHHLIGGWQQINVVYQIAKYGDLGVTFFFVLSGFVLTWSHQNKKIKPTFKVFLKNRLARIYPLHFAMLIVAAGFSIHNIYLAGYAKNETKTLIQHFLLIQGWIPWHPENRQSYNGVAWTLSAELMFYLLFIAIFNCFIKLRNNQLVFLCATIYISYGILAFLTAQYQISKLLDLLWYFPLFRLPEFFYGVAIATILKRNNIKISFKPSIAVVSLPLVVTLFHLILPANFRIIPILNFITIPTFVLLITSFATRELAGKKTLMKNSYLVRLGEESYALYISHAIYLGIFTYGLHNLGGVVKNPLAGSIITVAFVLSAISLSSILHAIIEIPSQKKLSASFKI